MRFYKNGLLHYATLYRRLILSIFAIVATGGVFGCTGIFDTTFVNATSGGVFPLTPGPEAAFVFVRAINDTAQNAEFIVTIERQVNETDDSGAVIFDEFGNVITRPTRETVRLNTFAAAPANELGVVFSCKNSAINIVGLGADLLPTDAAVFVGGQGTGGAAGFGVPASLVPPLERQAGNFSCGDTIIFRAFPDIRQAGGVNIKTLLLPGFEQPSSFTGPSTFVTLDQIRDTVATQNQ